jgi:ankyrin repeat protein
LAEKLVSRPVNILTFKNNKGYTPLLWATVHGHNQIVYTLLETLLRIENSDKNQIINQYFKHLAKQGLSDEILSPLLSECPEALRDICSVSCIDARAGNIQYKFIERFGGRR